MDDSPAPLTANLASGSGVRSGRIDAGRASSLGALRGDRVRSVASPPSRRLFAPCRVTLPHEGRFALGSSSKRTSGAAARRPGRGDGPSRLGAAEGPRRGESKRASRSEGRPEVRPVELAGRPDGLRASGRAPREASGPGREKPDDVPDLGLRAGRLGGLFCPLRAPVPAPKLGGSMSRRWVLGADRNGREGIGRETSGREELEPEEPKREGAPVREPGGREARERPVSSPRRVLFP